MPTQSVGFIQSQRNWIRCQTRSDGQSEEEMYTRALEVVRATNNVSMSHLQRKMGICCNHAARLIDLLEERGVIGPQVGAQPREIQRS